MKQRTKIWGETCPVLELSQAGIQKVVKGGQKHNPFSYSALHKGWQSHQQRTLAADSAHLSALVWA